MLCKTIKFPFGNLFLKIPSVIFDVLFWAINFLILAGCCNIFGTQGIFIASAIVLMAVYVMLKGQITINWLFIFSLIFAISYSIPVFIFTRDYFTSALLYAIYLPVVFQYFECFENKRKLTISLLSSHILGLFISFCLIVLSTYWHQGPEFTGEVVNSFWGDVLINRTGVSLYEIGLVCVFISCLSFKNQFRKIYTIPILLFVLFFCVFASFIIGNRSFLIPLVFVVFAIIVQKFLQPSSRWGWGIVLISYNIVIVSFFIIYYLTRKGVINIPESLLKINVLNRLFNVDIKEGRPQLLVEFFTRFYKYPLGNLNNNLSNGYVHNMLLDFYSFGGVIPFVLALTFTVFLVIKMLKFGNSAYRSSIEKSILCCLVVGIFALSMVEPVYQANANCSNILFIIFLYFLYAEKEEAKLIADGAPTYTEKNFKVVVKDTTVDIPELVYDFKEHGDAALVLIAFDKSQALMKSFDNLLKVDYLDKKVDLIISIDNCGSNDVEEVAKTLNWPFGNKIIRTFSERQGLKKHVLQCMQYAEVYDVVFLLEDDIYCSKAMFAYGYNAAKFYDNDESIAGISLYGYQGNWQNWAYRFEPYNSGFDNYFMKLAQSWGEVITKRQWYSFKEWYNQNKLFIRDEINVESINRWPDSSWLKFFNRYCFINDKYFVYPYISLTSNGNGVGIHNFETVNDFQVELQGEVKSYNFQIFDLNDKKTVVYDEYMNPIWLYHYLDFKKEDLSIDLWCTKRKSQLSRYVLTAGYYGKKYIKSYSLSLHPIELSIMNNVKGEGIYIYFSEHIKKKHPKKYTLMNYSLRTSDWRRIKLFSLVLFFKTIISGIKRKVKRWLK